MHARVVLVVGKGVLFREVSSIQRLKYTAPMRNVIHKLNIHVHIYIHTESNVSE